MIEMYICLFQQVSKITESGNRESQFNHDVIPNEVRDPRFVSVTTISGAPSWRRFCGQGGMDECRITLLLV